MSLYAVEPDSDHLDVASPITTTFDFDYTDGREQLLRLYDKGTRRQWIGSDRLDWSLEIDPTTRSACPTRSSPSTARVVGEDDRGQERGDAKRHLEAWRFSQFMHGEQGALICTAKIVQTVPDIDSKFYAATQVIDEARHVEVYSRYLHEKIQLVYPLNPHLRALLDDVIADSRWDMTYLGMQVLIEGLALAAFGLIRNMATEPLGKAINAYVMQDEARHVMFGRLALRDYYPQLTQAERDEREEFCVEACYRMRDRFLGEEVWERLGLPHGGRRVRRAQRADAASSAAYLFMRIVPILKDIGLWGPRDPERLHRHGRASQFADAGHRRRDGQRRGRRRGARRPPHGPHPRGRRPRARRAAQCAAGKRQTLVERQRVGAAASAAAFCQPASAQWTRRSWPAQYWARRAFLSALPTGVVGRLSTSSTRLRRVDGALALPHQRDELVGRRRPRPASPRRGP